MSVTRPPRLAALLMRSVLPEGERLALLGDYEEIFQDLAAERGGFAADLWYWRQVLAAAPVEILNSIRWSFIMIANYLKVAFRNLRRQKAYSLINITGLAVGLAGCLLILLWVDDERSFDRFHERGDRISRVCIVDDAVGADKKVAVTPLPLAPALKEDIPEVKAAARLSGSSMRMAAGDREFDQRGLVVSPDFLRMFSFPLLRGDPKTALAALDSIVITEETAVRLFRGEDPMGRVIESRRSGREYTVTGVLRDIPRQSHLRFDYLLNFRVLGRGGFDLDNWGNISYFAYVELREGADPEVVSRKITSCANARSGEFQADYFLQPLERIYLDPAYMFDPVPHGSRQNVRAFSLIAAAVLLMAVFNFVNLSTARSGRRSLEVGLRKVVGAGRAMLVRQFLGESLLVALAAAAAAGIAVILLLPTLNALSGKSLTLAMLIRGRLIGSFIGIVLVTGLASGFYPALFLSSFRPARVLQREAADCSGGALLRRALIVFQFALTIAVITGVLAVGRQLRYMRRLDLGFDKSNLVAVPLRGETASRAEALKRRLLQNPRITSAAVTGELPGRLSGGSLVDDWEGKSTEGRVHLKVFRVDPDYLDTFRIELADGRFFEGEPNPDFPEYVINQAAARAMGLDSPVGKRVGIRGGDGTIIGVVRDFNYRSLHHEIEPMVLIHEPDRLFNMVVRLAPGALDFPDTLEFIESLWKGAAPGEPFSYVFVDERLEGLYGSERLMGKLLSGFTGLSVLIAVLGVLGLAAYSVERRRREIGIRKVLGASLVDIIRLLSREFMVVAAAANLLAWPAAFFLLRRWLRNFAFRMDLSIGIFLLAGTLALGLMLVTIGYQSVRAGLSNPADSLRWE